MKSIVFLVLWVIMMSGCAVKKEAINNEPQKFERLTKDIMALGKNVNEKEAKMFAKEALTYPRVLVEKYDLVAPANFQNMLINIGYKERGLCFEWSEDMMAHLKKQRYKTIDLRWGVSHKGGPEEHNSVIAVAKGGTFESGLIIDPWRNSGDLYFALIPEDEKFKWVEDKQRTTILGTVKALR